MTCADDFTSMSFGCGFAAVEHVDAHADAVVVERRFEDRLAAAGRDERARRVDRGAQPALEAHDVAAAFAVEPARELADRRCPSRAARSSRPTARRRAPGYRSRATACAGIEPATAAWFSTGRSARAWRAQHARRGFTAQPLPIVRRMTAGTRAVASASSPVRTRAIGGISMRRQSVWLGAAWRSVCRGAGASRNRRPPRPCCCRRPASR